MVSLKYFLISAFAVLTVLLPLWIVFVNSVKTTGDANDLGVELPDEWRFGNYGTVFHEGVFLRGLSNTLIVTVPSLLGMLLFGSFAAWIFARGRSRVIRGLYYLSIVGILVPPAIVGSVLVLRVYHIDGSYLGLILFYMGIFMSFAIFFISPGSSRRSRSSSRSRRGSTAPGPSGSSARSSCRS
jgi:raffinose/stachyose/melibiose transport system permease protein